MTSTEYDDEESFGDFTFAPSVVNSIPKNKLTNGSDLSLNNNIDDDWGDFVNSSADLSRSESLHAKSSGSFDKSFDPLSFRVDQHNQNSQNDNSVPATEHDSVLSRIRAHFVKPKGALPLSLFGEAEKEEDNEDGSGAAGLLFNGATEVKTNDKKMRSDLNVSDMFSNLYKQSEGANGPKSDSKESSLNLGNLSSHGLILEYNGLDLNRSVSNLESNGLDWNGGVSNSGSNEVDLKRSVSTLDSNGLNWGLDGWEFKGSETKLPAGDLNIKSENAAPVVLKTENGPISNLNGFNLSWNVLGSDLNVSGSNVNGNLDANKSSLLVDDNEDFGDDDGWEFKVAESGTTTGDSYSKVNGKWPDNPVGVKHTFGFGNGAALPTDLFVESDVISQKSGELNFGFDFSQISATTNGISSNSFSDRKQGDNNKNSSNSTPINGNVGNGEIFFKDAFPETGSKDKGDEVELENQKGALPLPFFGDVEHETEDPLTYQDASTSNPASSTRDSTKKSPGPNISINDLISSLYSQAEQNTSVNHMQSPSENHLGSSQKVVDSNSTDGDGDFDDDSWEFKDAFSRTIGENQTSAAVDGESHKKYSTKVELKDFADFYSRLKDELYIVAHSHLDSLKKARSAAALCGEDDKEKALDNEIQDLYNELYGDRIISKEPHSESHPTSNICFDELVEVLQGPKFHVLESEYHLSKRLSLAEKNWKSAIELLKHVVSISKIITLGSKEEQSNYVSTWFKVVSICAQVLRHGSSIWKQSLGKNVHCQMLSDPRGKQYILALGEIYRAVEVLGSSAKFYKPWLLLSYADTAGVFTLLSECSNLWSSSGLEEAFQSISDPIGLEYNVTPKELLESVKSIHDLDAFALHNQVFSGQEPTCHLSLLTTGTVPGGVRPSRSSKGTWDSRRASELKVSSRAKSAADDGSKRKRMDDSLDTHLRNAKCYAAMPSSSGEVHEGSPPMSTMSSSSINLKVEYMDANGIGESNRERVENILPDSLRSSRNLAEVSSPNGDIDGHLIDNPVNKILALDTANSKDAEKLAIEKIMSGPCVTDKAFPQELDQLEDDLELKNQTKIFGGNTQDSTMGSSAVNTAVEATPTSMNGGGSSSALHTNGGLEELEPVELMAPSSNLIPSATVPQRKPIIRLSFTSLNNKVT